MWEHHLGCVEAFATCAKLVQDLVDRWALHWDKAAVDFGAVAETREIAAGWVDSMAVR
jgi:hypothetical protein